MGVDWRTTKGAALSLPEREWIHAATQDVAGRFDAPSVVHIGVEYGASVHVSRAASDNIWLTGIDLDCSQMIDSEAARVQLLEGDSTQAWRKFRKPTHLLFVDGNHSFEGVLADIQGWAHKVPPGGVIAFHDYRRAPAQYPWTVGVRQAVDGWGFQPTTWEEIPAPDSIKAFRRRPFLRRGETFGTIGIGCPYFKAYYLFFRWWSWVLMAGLEFGDKLLNNGDVHCEMPIPYSHNSIIRAFLRSDRDTLCIVEDDHTDNDGETVRRLRTKPENLDFDIVCATYTNRRGDLTCMGINLNEQRTPWGEYLCTIHPFEVARTGTQEYDAAAMGLVLIRRWVLEAMAEGHDWDEYHWAELIGYNSQDIVFYARAKAVGARVGVDRDCPIGHIGQHVFTMDEYYTARDKAAQEKQSAEG